MRARAIKFFALLFALLSVLSVPGCLAVQSQVAVFHELPPTLAGKKYAFQALKDQASSLEYRSYAQRVREELNKRGMIEVPVQDSEVVVALLYFVDQGKEVTYSVPVYGQTGVSSSNTFGTVQTFGGMGTYSGTTTYTPTYGVVGSSTASATMYTRVLVLHMIDTKALANKEFKKMYEAKVVSRGKSGSLPAVLPSMIKALFEDFPGRSGKVRTTTVTVD